MWGKVTNAFLVTDDDRITPAYAGKSWNAADLSLPDGDHPRVCGEKNGWRARISEKEGSPPRMRGKVLSTRTGSVKYEDHPRVCGEKILCKKNRR